jgi:hypothetical protein
LSLLEAPWAQQFVGPEKVVGILVASQALLIDANLAAMGVEIGSNYTVSGVLDDGHCPAFENL